MQRRTLLAGVGAALPLLGGCLTTPSNRPDETTAISSPSTPSPTESPAATMPSITDSQGPTRGESDVALETDAVEDDDSVEYVPAEDAVRYVARWRHTNGEEIREGEPPEREPVYETRPFDEWARTQCLTAAARAGADHVETELDADGVGGGITTGVDGKDIAAFVSISTTLDRDGEALSQPSITFDELVAATPSTVHVTYRLGDQAYQADAAVYAVHRVSRQE